MLNRKAMVMIYSKACKQFAGFPYQYATKKSYRISLRLNFSKYEMNGSAPSRQSVEIGRHIIV